MTFKNTVDSRYGPGTRQKIRKLEKLKIKLSRETNHVTYLTKCKKEGLVPKGLLLKPPYYSPKAKKIVSTASIKLMKDRLNFHLSNKEKLKNQVNIETENLFKLIGSEFENILKTLNKSAERQGESNKQSQIKKFNHLKATECRERKCMAARGEEARVENSTDATAPLAVINLSDKTLNQCEQQILSKGLNFSVAPKNVNVLDFITGIESATPQLAEDVADQFRSEASAALKTVKQIKPNTTRDERKALIALKKEENLKILPADKGNATVLLNKVDYSQKIQDVLKAGKYTLLKKDPTKSYESKIEKTLRKHKAFLTDKQRKLLTPHHSKTPHMYGLPKIHKAGIPMRPIVSSRDSPSRELCRFLLPILKPLSGNTDSHVTNTKHFVEITKEMQITDTDMLVSFDVESLFTNIPVNETLTIIETRLNNDNTLKSRTKLPVNVIMELLKLCTESNYFELEGQFYRQDEGMAMGSPLSPIFANIFMEDFEQKAIASARLQPKVWLRYVDDVFAVWSHGDDKLDEFNEHLNNISPNIKLTTEIEQDNKLAFLDVNVIKDSTTLKTEVFRKKTHTGRYLNYKSNHCESVKESVAYSLFDRAKSVCCERETLDAELNKISQELKNNGYPQKVIDKCKKNRETKQNIILESDKPIAFINIPYVPKLSEKIRRVARKYKIKTAFKSSNTLRQQLTKVKPKNEEQASKNSIYSIKCECDGEYIGESKRPLKVRLNEHKRNTKNGETAKSKLAKHAWDNDHKFRWEEAKILHHETHYYKRKFIEGALIKLHDNPISQSSIEVRPLWVPLIKEHFKNKIPPNHPPVSCQSDAPASRVHTMTLRHMRT